MRRSDRPGVEETAPPVPAVSLVHVTTVPMSLIFLTGQVGYMKERGVEVHVISSPGERLTAFGVQQQVPVFAVPMRREITPFHDLVAAWRMYRLLRRVRPQIVHSHTPKGGLLGMLAARLAGVPVRIYHLRGLPFETASGLKRRLLRITESVSCTLAHRVICVSRSVREIAVQEGICPPSKARVLLHGSGNGVDADSRFNRDRVPTGEEVRASLGIPAASAVVGYVGRVVRDKGIVELTKAWLQLRDRFPDLHLLVVGPLEPQDPVPPEVEAVLRDDPRVHLRGVDWDTPPLYAAMDLVVLPTYREGFPNVALEAAAMELPVVATRVSGCVDAVVEGATGLLVPVGDPASLADAMRRYLEDPLLRQSHGRAARARVLQEYSPEQIWRALHLEYLELLQRAGIARGSAGPCSGSASESERVAP